jgi:hypothetical protein
LLTDPFGSFGVEIPAGVQARSPADAAFLPANDHTRERASARAARMARKPFSPESASVSIRRETVGSEATGPKRAGSALSVAMSARQSPPGATARAT